MESEQNRAPECAGPRAMGVDLASVTDHGAVDDGAVRRRASTRHAVIRRDRPASYPQGRELIHENGRLIHKIYVETRDPRWDHVIHAGTAAAYGEPSTKAAAHLHDLVNMQMFVWVQEKTVRCSEGAVANPRRPRSVDDRWVSAKEREPAWVGRRANRSFRERAMPGVRCCVRKARPRRSGSRRRSHRALASLS